MESQSQNNPKCLAGTALWLTVAWLLWLVCPAQGAVVSETITVAPAQGDFTVPIEVPRFDPSLGVLESVAISLEATGYSTESYENLGVQADTITFQENMGLVLGFSGGGESSSMISLSKGASSEYRPSPFNGAFNFSGASGGTVTSTMSASGQTTMDSAYNFAFFTGKGFANLYLSVTGELSRNDATGQGDAEGALSVGACVVVSYFCQTVPEPSSWTWATALLMAGAGIARSVPWKRRRGTGR